MSDYYSLLGVPKNASADDIKKAFRKKAMENHPDKHKGDAAAEKKFKEINEAYDVLKDPQKRAHYDQFGMASSQSGGAGYGGQGGFNAGGFNFTGGADFSDIFENIFSEFAGGRSQKQSRAKERGEDLIYQVSISLEDAFFGVEKSIRFKHQEPCDACHGTGSKSKKKPRVCPDCQGAGVIRMRQGFFVSEHPCPHCHGTGFIVEDACSSCGGQGIKNTTRELDVSIPKGIESGMRIRLKGEGNAAPFSGHAGDLFVEVHIEPHRTFEREGPDLFAQIKVSFTTAILGGEVEIQMLDQKNGSVKIPAGTQPNTQIRLRGKGMPVVQSNLHGDLYLTVQVEIPQKINEDQEKALKAFEKATKKKSFGIF